MPRPRPLSALVTFAGLVVAAPAFAQMTPLQDLRVVNANAHYGGITDAQALTPPGFFASWNPTLEALAQTDNGETNVSSFQISEFFPAGIYFSGGTTGAWSGVPTGSYEALSLAKFRVHIDACVDYSFFADVAPGSLPGSAYVEVRGPSGTLIHVDDGESTIDGRLAPGDYEFEGRSSLASSAQSSNGGVYAMTWTVSACQGTLITSDPADLIVACDAPATFCVVPAGPVGNFTYQWRRNYVPIVDNGHFTGATTPCLTIHHACYADIAAYDVVVTAGLTAQPSNPAHLGISSIAVGADPAPATWTVGPATPNPFGVATSCRYVAPRPFVAHVAVYDAAGRQVRRIADGRLEASGTLTWDGRTAAGVPAVPGVYFLRIEADDHRAVRRIALVR